MVFMIMDTTKSTSRRQGRLREERSEGSRSAYVRDDEQKPHIRLSLWASWHNTTKPAGSGGRVNAAFVHGKFTFLSGEICASRAGISMNQGRKRFTRVIKYPARRLAVGWCESPSGETQNRQRLMDSAGAPTVETRGVSTQKSAEGIVGTGLPRPEGPNVERSVAIS